MILMQFGESVQFYARADAVFGLRDFGLSSAVETDDSTVDDESFVKKKSSGKYEITLTAVLSAALGVDPQAAALDLAKRAREGETGYLYAQEKKLLPNSFMLTSAKISGVEISPAGTWTYAEAALTLTQASKADGTTSSRASEASSSGGADGGSGRKSAKKKNPKSKEFTDNKEDIPAAVNTVTRQIETLTAERNRLGKRAGYTEEKSPKVKASKK